MVRQPIESRMNQLGKKKIFENPIENNNLKHVKQIKRGRKFARASLGSLEINDMVLINGCLRHSDTCDEEAFPKIPVELKGIAVDIRGPGGELLCPVKKERGTFSFLLRQP